MKASQVRQAFVDFFVERGHSHQPSASLIPHDPTLLFTVAGMVPFKPYFVGEEPPPFPRAVTVQKCVRAGGKHNDLDEIGRTSRHLTYFEMLGNFSFGDYFKPEAVAWAWELVTGPLGLDPDRLWVTVHVSDDEAEAIWRDQIGVPAERIQRLDEDNYWRMADTGPCGPCSEIFWDRGPEYGPGGGPAFGGDERYIEIWNLVFMQFETTADGAEHPLPKPSIDTGLGLERTLSVLQGVDSVWETDELARLLAAAEKITGARARPASDGGAAAPDRATGSDGAAAPDRTAGSAGGDANGAGSARASSAEVSLRILADHARSTAMLVSDGVFPSNEARGYVLRRIIRRAVRHAYLLGVAEPVMGPMVDAVVEVMGGAHPDLARNHGYVRDVIDQEERRFAETLRTGQAILDERLDGLAPGDTLAGDVAFLLHDTYGFPLEVTEEITAERGIEVDAEGFRAAMSAQQQRAKQARKTAAADDVSPFVRLVDDHGETEFTGRDQTSSTARVLHAADGKLVLDRTPFYAESGGQIGDTGEIVSATGARARVADTRYGVPGLHVHHVEPVEGELRPGDEVTAAIDADRRAAIRRNHTATHLLHWALRQALGEHVKQQGSEVGPDRLRFDFSHYAAMTPAQIAEVEDLVNDEILANDPCRHFETTMAQAQQLGAIAFFGDKYGDTVRVLEAGRHSVELCGGTHVRALGDIGAFKITAESSIGSNIRRVEAVTGRAVLELVRRQEASITEAAQALGVPAAELAEGVAKRQAETKALRDEVARLGREAALGRAGELAAAAVDGVVVARVDGVDRDGLRDLALSVRDRDGVQAVVLGAALGSGGAALAAAADGSGRFDAGALIDEAKRTIGGGGRSRPDLSTAGGKHADRLDQALDQARAAAAAAAGVAAGGG